jgi:hemerythrin-like domain-containing protein
LDKLEQRWRDEEGTFAGHLTATDAPLASQCSQLWTTCYTLVKEMEEEALEMPSDMRNIHSTLADIHRQLQELAERDHTADEVKAVIKQLDTFDAVREEHGGLFVGDIEAPPPGHAVCTEILHQNYDLARMVLTTAHDEPAELKNVADTLRSIRNDLRKLSVQRHHTKEDIAHYRFLVMAILSAQAEYASEWEDSQAKKLSTECLNIVKQLEATAEEMNAEMKRIFSELTKLKKELSTAVSKAGRPADEELKSWIGRANVIDDERAKSNGVFGGKEGDVGGVEAPAGQAVCAHLLEDCYRMLKELLERN